jgi:hypothetical protein
MKLGPADLEPSSVGRIYSPKSTLHALAREKLVDELIEYIGIENKD